MINKVIIHSLIWILINFKSNLYKKSQRKKRIKKMKINNLNQKITKNGSIYLKQL